MEKNIVHMNYLLYKHDKDSSALSIKHKNTLCQLRFAFDWSKRQNPYVWNSFLVCHHFSSTPAAFICVYEKK